MAQDAASTHVVRVTEAEEAIARLEGGEIADVYVLEPGLPDPVRVAQRLHTLDPPASVVIAGAGPEVAHALEAAPFLEGDVICHAGPAGELDQVVTAAAARARLRRANDDRRADPPPLSSQYLGTLLDNAPIGVITLDEHGAVSGWNRRAGELLEEAEVEALGRPFTDLFPSAERARVQDALARLGSGDLRSPGEVVATRSGFMELTGARFTLRDGAEGAIVVLSDVTERERASAELAHVAHVLQESLLPPHLPDIPGLDIAARFLPAGTGVEVGGDFYDVFETHGEQAWGAVIGDVCGKGADAAALTALTRYTARAAGMYEDRPSGVLSVLNEALLRQRTDLRFTTVAYCCLELSTSPIQITVACGGHPRPLVLRAAGGVEPVGGDGPLIGVIPDAEFTDAATTLSRGDAIVLYTDGVTDAHAPARALHETDLCAGIGGCAGLGAHRIADRLVEIAVGGRDAPPRDDIAVLVVKVL